MKKEVTFEHYIVTRFNLPIFGAKVNGHDSKSCNKDYLDYRFDLFEHYCMPSIINQSCQNFKWLVLFDDETPHEFKERAYRLHEQYNNLIPCFFNVKDYEEENQDYKTLSEEYAKIVLKYFPKKKGDLSDKGECMNRLYTPRFIMDSIKKCSSFTPDYYITTRIDNDDAFHKDMIRTVQQRFKNDPRHVIFDFVYSYKFILNERIVYKYPLLNGHFLSLVEPTNRLFQSALYWNHLFVDKFLSVEHIYGTPLQIELIHGNNVINYFSEPSFKGFLYAFIHFRRKNFGYKHVRVSYLRQLYVLGSYVKKMLRKAVK